MTLREESTKIRIRIMEQEQLETTVHSGSANRHRTIENMMNKIYTMQSSEHCPPPGSLTFLNIGLLMPNKSSEVPLIIFSYTFIFSFLPNLLFTSINPFVFLFLAITPSLLFLSVIITVSEKVIAIRCVLPTDKNLIYTSNQNSFL